MHDLGKFIEDLEDWKDHKDKPENFLSSLPEFNIENNMPVEDDENLEKDPNEW